MDAIGSVSKCKRAIHWPKDVLIDSVGIPVAESKTRPRPPVQIRNRKEVVIIPKIPQVFIYDVGTTVAEAKIEPRVGKRAKH